MPVTDNRKRTRQNCMNLCNKR